MIGLVSAPCEDSRQTQDSDNKEARDQRAPPDAVQRVAPSQRPGIFVPIE
jgi:hypothetical protein